MSLNEKVFIKLRHGRELTGRLIAYDEHLNLMIGDAKERVSSIQTD